MYVYIYIYTYTSIYKRSVPTTYWDRIVPTKDSKKSLTHAVRFVRHYVLVSTPGPPQNSILYLLFPTCSLLQIGGKSPLNKASLSNLQFGVWKPHMGHRTSG